MFPELNRMFTELNKMFTECKRTNQRVGQLPNVHEFCRIGGEGVPNHFRATADFEGPGGSKECLTGQAARKTRRFGATAGWGAAGPGKPSAHFQTRILAACDRRSSVQN